MSFPTDSKPFQKAWIVNDIERTAESWSELLNIGPFFVAEYKASHFETLLYRGEPGTLTMKTAIAYAGAEQIELVEPIGEYPSAYRDTIPIGETGFHHLCFWSDDIDGDLAHYRKLGFQVANEGKMAGGGPRFAYVDTSSTLDCMVELLERSPGIEKLFGSWRDACDCWDGVNPIVRL